MRGYRRKNRSMARPRLQEHEKRTERYNLRFTLAEMDHIRDQAVAAGQDVSEYLRRRALGYKVPAAGSSRRIDPALISELNSVGVNINQLAKATHLGREFSHYWQSLGEELTQILERLVDQELGDP